jgi:hypothetical protein
VNRRFPADAATKPAIGWTRTIGTLGFTDQTARWRLGINAAARRGSVRTTSVSMLSAHSHCPLAT